ncbi:MAG: hypothetical protein A3K09_04600, partial [Nitrospinae bacterium RIFCSPLOWO2_12_FULL_47_7]
MGKPDKILAKMKINPLDWRIEDVQSAASRFGVEWNHEGTSHVIFRAPNASKLTIPAKRGIKPVYIRKFVKWIEGLKGASK